MQKSQVFQVRCAEQEKLAWQELAKAKGVSLSEYTRSLLNGMLALEKGGEKGG